MATDYLETFNHFSSRGVQDISLEPTGHLQPGVEILSQLKRGQTSQICQNQVSSPSIRPLNQSLTSYRMSRCIFHCALRMPRPIFFWPARIRIPSPSTFVGHQQYSNELGQIVFATLCESHQNGRIFESPTGRLPKDSARPME